MSGAFGQMRQPGPAAQLGPPWRLSRDRPATGHGHPLADRRHEAGRIDAGLGNVSCLRPGGRILPGDAAPHAPERVTTTRFW